MPSEENNTAPPSPSWKEQGYVPMRYVVVLMVSSGVFLSQGLRNSMNFTILTMVSSSGSNSTNDSDVTQTACGVNVTQEAEAEYEGEFHWDEWTQGLILGAFYWGYIWTQLPGGYLTEIFGGRYVFGGTIVMQAITNMLMPVAAHMGSVALICARVLMGFFGGALYPSFNCFVSCWAPPQERTTLITLCHIGSGASFIVMYPFLAVLIKNIGWESAFYIPSAITLVWCIVWFIVVSDSPHSHKWITNVEKDYIINSLGETKSVKRPPVPWRALLTSVPFWALVIAQFGDGWGYTLLIADLPLYMKKMMGEDLSSNAFWSSLPQVGQLIVSITAAVIGDAMLKRQMISRGILRKGFHFTGQITQGVCMLALTFLMCDNTTAHWVFFVSQSFAGFAIPGYLANYMDLAPNFTGTINGIGNAIGTATGWMVPMTTGFLVNNQQTLGQWRKVWYVAAAMFLCNLVVYLIFGSGDVQPWNYVEDDKLVLHDQADGYIENKINKDKQNKAVKEEDLNKSDAYNAYVTDSNFRQSKINHAFDEK